MMPQQVVLSTPTQDFALSSPAIDPPGETTGAGHSLLIQIMTIAKEGQESSAANLNMRLDQIASGRLSTADMVRLQAEMGTFSYRVQLTVRIADDIGRAIQTLTQRS